MKQLFDGKWHENKELQNKAEKVEKSDETTKITCEFDHKQQK